MLFRSEEIEDGSELKLGDAPMESPLNIKNHQASNLGDAQGTPSPSSTIKVGFFELSFYHFTYYVLCLERLLLSLLFGFLAGHIFVGS